MPDIFLYGGAVNPNDIVLRDPSLLEPPLGLRQIHFRFRTDTDPVDATPTWGAEEDTN
jgi:hypothetical protein